MKSLEKHAYYNVTIETPGQGLVDITSQITGIVHAARLRHGLCVIYCRHTSCSLLIQENADPAVLHDLTQWLARLAPENDPTYTHTAEGPDDMPAHLKAAVLKTSESIPIVAYKLVLGQWQGIYLAEHRKAPHSRQLVVYVAGSED